MIQGCQSRVTLTSVPFEKKRKIKKRETRFDITQTLTSFLLSIQFERERENCRFGKVNNVCLIEKTWPGRSILFRLVPLATSQNGATGESGFFFFIAETCLKSFESEKAQEVLICFSNGWIFLTI